MDIQEFTFPDDHQRILFQSKSSNRTNIAKVNYGIMLKNRAEYNNFLSQKE